MNDPNPTQIRQRTCELGGDLNRTLVGERTLVAATCVIQLRLSQPSKIHLQITIRHERCHHPRPRPFKKIQAHQWYDGWVFHQQQQPGFNQQPMVGSNVEHVAALDRHREHLRTCVTGWW